MYLIMNWKKISCGIAIVCKLYKEFLRFKKLILELKITNLLVPM